jgi:hypothetical protein
MQTRQAGFEQTGEIVLRDLVKEALRTHISSFRTIDGEAAAEGWVGAFRCRARGVYASLSGMTARPAEARSWL